jgi:hypothetical protein
MQTEEPAYTFTSAASTGPGTVSVASASGSIFLAVAELDGSCFIGVSRTTGRVTADTTGPCLAASFLTSTLLDPVGSPTTTAGPTTTTGPTTTIGPTTTTGPSPLTTVRVLTSTGAPVAGAVVTYVLAGYPSTFGTTGSNGITTANLAADSTTMAIAYAGGTDSRSVTVGPGTLITFSTVPLTVQLLTSTGTGIPGATVNQYNPYWNLIGTTATNGTTTKEVLPGTYQYFEVVYAGANVGQTNIVVSGPTTITFTTVEVTVTVTNGGTSVAGASVSYLNPYSNSFGSTGSAGQVTKQMLEGTYASFTATWSGGSAQLSNVVLSGPTAVGLAA